jgi:hypothetical protein
MKRGLIMQTAQKSPIYLILSFLVWLGAFGLIFQFLVGCNTTTNSSSRAALLFRYELILPEVIPRDGTARDVIEAAFGRPLGQTLRTLRRGTNSMNNVVFDIYPEGLLVHYDAEGRAMWAHFLWREKLGPIGLEPKNEHGAWSEQDLRWVLDRLFVVTRNTENGFYGWERGSIPALPDVSRWAPMPCPSPETGGYCRLGSNELSHAYALARWYAIVGVRVPPTKLDKMSFIAFGIADAGRSWVHGEFYDSNMFSPDPRTGRLPAILGGPPSYVGEKD